MRRAELPQDYVDVDIVYRLHGKEAILRKRFTFPSLAADDVTLRIGLQQLFDTKIIPDLIYAMGQKEMLPSQDGGVRDHVSAIDH